MPRILKHRALLRLGVALGVAATAAAACAPVAEPPNLPVRRQGQLLVQVVDQHYDAGRGASVALHQDGTPAVSYLLYKPVLKPGDIPPPVVPGEPQPPAVIFATLAEGVWNRTSLTPQINNPAEGDAPGLANDEGQALPGTRTAIAVDGQDRHHVAWSTPKGGLFYASDAAGSFGEADRITESPAFGVSIALGPGGTPWVSFYSGGSLRVAQRTAGTWTIEEIQRNAGPASDPATVTAIRITSGGEPIVAYGDQGRTVVARRSGGAWNTEQVPGDGGYGISLALDSNGVPHVAFYDVNGNVRLARSTGGGSWESADVATTAAGPDGKSDPRWSTGIGVDGDGTTVITWSDTKANQIMLADNRDDTVNSRPVLSSTNGTNSSLALSADGQSQALVWFDSANANLEVAQTASGDLILAHPLTPAATPTGGATTPPPAECQPDGTALQVAAPVGASASGFDKNCLAAPAGEAFTIDFDNQDTGQVHNVSIYTDPTAATRLGGATGPADFIVAPDSVTYEVEPLDAGTFFFRCDVHPTTMTGTFIAQ
ncbi:MAG: cupredoxin domain-containing protein [Actinomycetota bacterium]